MNNSQNNLSSPKQGDFSSEKSRYKNFNPKNNRFLKDWTIEKNISKNHFVPEFLLKHFTRVNEPEVINVTDLLRNKTYPKNISDVCYEKYLNTVDYEKYISSEYESKYDRTIRKIKEFIYQGELDQPIPSDLLNEITDMVAFIHSHNLFWRKTMADEVSTSIMEKHDIESHTIDYRSQDIIPKQLFDFWKGELYCWTIIRHYNGLIVYFCSSIFSLSYKHIFP